ncbi:Hypothetical predicted protein [Podarcis lilfordi]|uniref:Uncharacterized protein n=1 Tax=Podarcis lilfordi TaxID=74358 RepID=A0AA35PW66_9SAUR|nr:Hypothetical predicted protein [Podarcis lilfordi]
MLSSALCACPMAQTSPVPPFFLCFFRQVPDEEARQNGQSRCSRGLPKPPRLPPAARFGSCPPASNSDGLSIAHRSQSPELLRLAAAVSPPRLSVHLSPPPPAVPLPPHAGIPGSRPP